MASWSATDLKLLRTVTHPAQQIVSVGTDSPPLGPGFDATLTLQSDRMEVWGTTDEAPEDYTEFRLLKEGRILGVARIPGY